MAGGAGPHETENKRMIYSLVSRHSMAGSDSEHDSEEEDERLRRIMEFVETRDVLVYDSTSKVAGFHQNGGILTSVFIRWLSYVLDVPAPFRLALRNAECAAEPLHEDQLLAPGEYNIVRTVDGLPLSTPPRADIHSIPRFLLRDRPGSEPDEVFRRAVYERDGERSAIAPTPADLAGVLRSWEVAEVFPIGALDMWLDSNLPASTGFTFETRDDLVRALHMPWNGMVMTAEERDMWDCYEIAIDVDDDYRLVHFHAGAMEPWSPGSRWNLKENLLREARPPDSLLRAHFVQALLHWVVRRPDDMQIMSWPVLVNAFRGPLNDFFDVDLGHPRWTADAGKQVLEQYMMHRLYGCLPPLLRGPGDAAERKRYPSGADPLDYLIAKRRRAQLCPGGSPSPISRWRKLDCAGRWSSSDGEESTKSPPGSLRHADDSSSSSATSDPAEASANALGAHLHVDIEIWPEKFHRSFWSPGYVLSPPRLDLPSVPKDADDGTFGQDSQASGSVQSEFDDLGSLEFMPSNEVFALWESRTNAGES